MGVDTAGQEFHGIDCSDEFLRDEAESREDRIIYITNAGGRWVAAVSDRYKLVLSRLDRPWLFDLEKDPDELNNCWDNPEYGQVRERLLSELNRQMKAFKEPALEKGNLRYN